MVNSTQIIFDYNNFAWRVNFTYDVKDQNSLERKFYFIDIFLKYSIQ